MTAPDEAVSPSINDAPLCRLYLCGPPVDQSDARARYDAATGVLQLAGFDTVSPLDCVASCEVSGQVSCASMATRAWPTDAHDDHRVRGDVTAMLACGGVALLPEWWMSRNARIEYSVAVLAGLPVMMLSEWLR